MESYKVNSKIQEDRAVFAGLAGLSVASLLSIPTMDSLDYPLQISVCAFAIAIPLLVFIVITVTMEMSREYTVDPWYCTFAQFTGIVASVIGLSAFVWHISMIAGIILLTSSLISFSWLLKFDASIKKVNGEEE